MTKGDRRPNVESIKERSLAVKLLDTRDQPHEGLDLCNWVLHLERKLAHAANEITVITTKLKALEFNDLCAGCGEENTGALCGWCSEES